MLNASRVSCFICCTTGSYRCNTLVYTSLSWPSQEPYRRHGCGQTGKLSGVPPGMGVSASAVATHGLLVRERRCAVCGTVSFIVFSGPGLGHERYSNVPSGIPGIYAWGGSKGSSSSGHRWSCDKNGTGTRCEEKKSVGKIFTSRPANSKGMLSQPTESIPYACTV